MLLPKDYVRYRLRGEHAIDAADASGTLLSTSPRVAGATRCSRRSTCPQTGCRPCTSRPVAGAGDQAAAALGVGIDRPGPLSVVLGTSGVVFAVLPAYVADPQARLHVFCHAVPGTWHAMGVMLSAAGSLRWLRDVLGGGLDELVSAGGWPPGVEGLLFTPYLAGERTLHADPDARGAFAGLGLRHDRGALARAVLEGVAFGLRDSLELFAELGVEPTVGRGPAARAASSGCGSSRPCSGCAGADASKRGSAFGAALLGGVAAGVFGSAEEAVAACVRPGPTVAPSRHGREA